jgi:hypothetical protein
MSTRRHIHAPDGTTIVDVDPFAGDDEPWAHEDVAPVWLGDAHPGSALRAEHSFLRVLVLVGVFCGVMWAAILAVLLEVYRALAG